MLFLRNEELQGCLTMDECLEVLEQGYDDLANDLAGYRPRIDLWAPCGKPDAYYRWGTMEGADARMGYFAIRMKSDIMYWMEGKTEEKYCVEPGTFCGLIFLFSTRNGEPLAILNDGFIQHMRVGACAGLGAKYLSRSDSRVVGIVGSGGMARTYLEAFSKVRSISRAQVYSPTRGNLETYCEEMSRKLGISVKAVDNAEQVFEGADIVATCTDSYLPVFNAAWLAPGQYYTNVTTFELDYQAVVKKCEVIVKLGETSLNPRADIGGGIKFRGPTASVFIGTSEQLEVIPSKRSVDVTSYPHLIDLKAGRVAGRTDDSQITFFINQGTQGLQFATVAGTSYELARANGLGIEIPTEWFLQNIRD
jgi:alanine dehydrogenase